MAYKLNTGTGSEVFIQNDGEQTFITLMSFYGSQQQSSSTSFTTGVWISPPVAFQTAAGLILELTTSQGKRFVNIQGNSISTQTQGPVFGEAKILNLEEVSMPKMQQMEPMKPMEPMQPLKMGVMEMNMNPMEMRLGEMRISMGNQDSNPKGKNFCSQCGSAVQAADRFCSNCGHKLN